MGCYIWYSEETERAAAPLSFLAVLNVTAHPSTQCTNFIFLDMALYDYFCTLKGEPIEMKLGIYDYIREICPQINVCKIGFSEVGDLGTAREC